MSTLLEDAGLGLLLLWVGVLLLACGIALWAEVWHLWHEHRDRGAARRLERLVERERSRIVARCVGSTVAELDCLWELPTREPSHGR